MCSFIVQVIDTGFTNSSSSGFTAATEDEGNAITVYINKCIVLLRISSLLRITEWTQYYGLLSYEADLK